MPEQLTPGCPSETGTYFAIIKSYVNDELEKCVLHYQKHKGLLRAVGHSFNCEVKEEDVVGYVGQQITQERADFIREANGRDLNGIGNKDREIEFAEWCINNHGWEFEPYSEEYRWMKGGIYYTTEQLYEQYNQQKEGMK